MAVMIATLLGAWRTGMQVVQSLDAKRDAAVLGEREGVRLSLTHRWQLFFDWVAMATALVGLYAALIYAVLSVAGMAETQSVRWFGYVASALAGWGIAMLVLVGGVSDGMLIVRTLRAEKRKGGAGSVESH